jgi:hypothetical protein
VVHLDYESLHEAFPKEILPEWLGGNCSHEDALDTDLMSRIFSPDTEEFYIKLFSSEVTS